MLGSSLAHTGTNLKQIVVVPRNSKVLHFGFHSYCGAAMVPDIACYIFYMKKCKPAKIRLELGVLFCLRPIESNFLSNV